MQMPEIGIRELKSQASEIVRAVRDERAEYIITLRGKPVAMIVPFEEAHDEKMMPADEYIARLLEIGREISATVLPGPSVLEQLFEDREES
jgi:prevent-host-death family protein